MNSPYEPAPGVYHTWEKPWPEWRHGNPGELRARVDGVLSAVRNQG